MKKWFVFALALVILTAGTAWAAASQEVKCQVNGKIRKAESPQACAAIGGLVLSAKPSRWFFL